MPGQLHPRDARMRDYSTSRSGFDRVLMAVAATFLTVSTTAALAQSTPPRNSTAELAIDAAVPRPEPANVPPPTVNDFKPDTTASVPDAKSAEKAVDTKPAETEKKDAATAPAATSPASTTTTAAPAAEPAKEPVKAASSVAPADQPVADKLREALGAKSSKYFDRKAERAAVEKFYATRDYAPLFTQSGAATALAKSVSERH